MPLTLVFAALQAWWPAAAVARVRRAAPHMLLAGAVTAVAVGVAAGLAYAVKQSTVTAVRTAVAGRDAHWQAVLSAERARVLAAQIERDRAAAAAADDARAAVAAERDAATAQVERLEAALAAAESATTARNAKRQASGRRPAAVDPVVWPKAVAREMR